jgi:hypothetical protein
MPDPGYYMVSVSGSVSYVDGDGNPIGPTYSTTQPTNAYYTAVGVSKLQYQTGAGWADAPSPIYVVTGTNLQLKAIPNPPDAQSWPSGTPTWTGATGSGATATLATPSHSASLTSPTVVTATCGGSQASASVIACDLNPVVTPQDNFTGRSLTRFGVGEKLNLSFTTTPAGVSAAALGGLTWDQIVPAGGGILSSSVANDGSAMYVCPDTASVGGTSVSLDIRVLSGPSQGATKNTSFSVVTPNAMHYVPFLDYHVNGHASVGFWAHPYLEPRDVSFENCMFQELTTMSIMQGWMALKFPSGQKHNPGDPTPVGNGNLATGCSAAYDDDCRAFSPYYDEPPTWADGSFVWNIPQQYEVNGEGSWHTFTTSQQEFDIDDDGTMSVTKGDSGTVTEAVDDQSVP